jgi:hypothetical protein
MVMGQSEKPSIEIQQFVNAFLLYGFLAMTE